MLGLKLNHVSKRGHKSFLFDEEQVHYNLLYYILYTFGPSRGIPGILIIAEGREKIIWFIKVETWLFNRE